MTDNVWQDPDARAWVKDVLENMVPKLEESAIVAQIIPGGEHLEGDVTFWVELGASIMLDKPIIAIAVDGRDVPEKLNLIADAIVYAPDGLTDDVGDELNRTMRRVLEERGLL